MCGRASHNQCAPCAAQVSTAHSRDLRSTIRSSHTLKTILTLDVQVSFVRQYRRNILSLGSMRSLLAIAALLLALFFAVAPAEAACGDGVDLAVAAGDAQSVSDLSAVTSGGHCQHVPCSDSTHNHTLGGCAGHSVFPAFAFETPYFTTADIRVAFTCEDSSGRTLLPPVPPPLA